MSKTPTPRSTTDNILATTTDNTLESIEDAILNIIRSIVKQKKSPIIQIPKRDRKKDIMKEIPVNFGHKGQRPHFTILIHTMSKIYEFRRLNHKCTTRDLYYDYVLLYKSQRHLDTIMTEICQSLKIYLFDTNINASSKGLIAGHLNWTGENGQECNLTQFNSKGMLISMNLLDITTFWSDARFILFIEKDAIFQQLLESHVFDILGECILIAGKGYCDRVSRRLLYKLSRTLNIPTLALVDADPYGIDIAANIKWGSVSQECFNLTYSPVTHETIPDLIWLGILPTDINELDLDQDTLIELTLAEEKKLKALKQRALKNNAIGWIDQMNYLSNLGVKAEIEAINITPGFLCNIYLRNRIQKLIGINISTSSTSSS